MHHDHEAMMHHDHAAMAQDHSMHAALLDQKPTIRSVASYPVPDVKLTGVDGEKVALNAALAKGPVMVNFIYTTCTTICPVLSATFSEVQGKLDKEGAKVNMISISIDPDQDTPARLKEYAAKFHAGPNWQFLTGSQAESIAVQKAFDAYRGDKMNHIPLTLMRASPQAPWVRVDGFASAADLVAEYRKATGDKVASR
ncbi:MAG: SCO family protein [Sulfuricella sp.]|nr:SCO family protein [Sulfuricella sp.]